MSRICIKGLPLGSSEEKLRAFLAHLGDVTDVKIARTKDGRSRQFAFVGFKSDGSAATAVRKFNNAYMGTSKLVVGLICPESSAAEKVTSLNTLPGS
jgi:multiple RNA-binding domain-containing protein 1